jgi:hypothetical protein
MFGAQGSALGVLGDALSPPQPRAARALAGSDHQRQVVAVYLTDATAPEAARNGAVASAVTG